MDTNSKTYVNRVKLGFLRNYRDWAKSPAVFSRHALKINGHPVMEDWEAGYMSELAAIASSVGGRVLEVGFGMGIASSYIQAHDIDEHIIIENNLDVFRQLETFRSLAAKKVVALCGFWQDLTPKIKSNSIDGILFDTYPLTESEIHSNHFDFFKEAWRLLRIGGVLTYYSDESQDFSVEHLCRLETAGFLKISKKVVSVCPPADCKYWQAPTIIAPIVVKSYA